MLLIPAIDLLEGKVVRLFKGEFSQPTYYPFTPLEVLKMWEEWGFRRIHVVDLEGAKYGETRHRDLILQLKKNFKDKKISKWGNSIIKVSERIPPTTLLRIPASVGPSLSMPIMERGTENHIVELTKQGAKGINVTPLGESGFVKANGTVNKHFDDQLKLFVNWQYKPMLFDKEEIEKVAESRKTIEF